MKQIGGQLSLVRFFCVKEMNELANINENSVLLKSSRHHEGVEVQNT